jgi:hypothetical protein
MQELAFNDENLGASVLKYDAEVRMKPASFSSLSLILEICRI